MRYVFGMIEKCKEDIEIQKRKIEREKREKLPNYEIPLMMAENKIKSAKHIIDREQIEKHKLLNDPNEITRNAAQELYDRYLHSSESARRRDQY